MPQVSVSHQVQALYKAPGRTYIADKAGGNYQLTSRHSEED